MLIGYKCVRERERERETKRKYSTEERTNVLECALPKNAESTTQSEAPLPKGTTN